jgi:hypothetical protein
VECVGKSYTCRSEVHAFFANKIDYRELYARVSRQDVKNGKSQSNPDRRVRGQTISMINVSLNATAGLMNWALCLVAAMPNKMAGAADALLFDRL